MIELTAETTVDVYPVAAADVDRIDSYPKARSIDGKAGFGPM